ncbi:MAG: radical SAM family heme chaperone HemW [Planctomycetes bacterium]|nr:radical SAM family heme chaperone HemW [Planctomycetota bacterium]
MNQAGLYVHVPLCAKRCPYCAFVLIESDGGLHERFVGAVLRQMERVSGEFRRVPFISLYLGGGTPSLLEPEQVARFIETARARFEACEPLEITLEANPDGIHAGRLRAFREAGVNRLSLGLQSLDDEELAFLGRTHTAAQGTAAYEAARAAGFGNVVLDVMFGVPGQTPERWTGALKRIVALAPEHVSLYGLTVENGTALGRWVKSGLSLPGEEDQKVLYEIAMDVLPENGYRHYELSNFARPGYESVHNSGYWDGRPYLGFGPGAHSYWPHRRWANVSNTRYYLRRSATGEDVTWMREELTREQRMLERAFLGLRRARGISTSSWEGEFGEPIEARFGAVIDEYRELGMLERRGDFLALTRAGRLLADSVVAKFA